MANTAFNIFLILVSLFFVGLSIANLTYWGKVGRGEPMKEGAIKSMKIINWIILIVCIVIIIGAGFILYNDNKSKMPTVTISSGTRGSSKNIEMVDLGK